MEKIINIWKEEKDVILIVIMAILMYAGLAILALCKCSEIVDGEFVINANGMASAILIMSPAAILPALFRD